MTLRAVPDQPPRHVTVIDSTGIPAYEHKEVSATSMVLTSVAGLDVDNTVVGIDDIVHFAGEGRVIGVNHIVDEKTGQLVRVQRVRPLELTVVPWSGADDGVVRGQ